VLLEVPVEVARKRLETSARDRLEHQDAGFHARVAAGYQELAARDPGRWVVVDGTRGIDDVTDAVADAVERRLGRPR
jgi:dTMP kinase